MWAYLAAYKAPHDDEQAQRARVHVTYPIVADRAIGLGELPTTRLQRALARSGVDGAGGPRVAELRLWTGCSCGRTGAGSRSLTARCST